MMHTLRIWIVIMGVLCCESSFAANNVVRPRLDGVRLKFQRSHPSWSNPFAVNPSGEILAQGSNDNIPTIELTYTNSRREARKVFLNFTNPISGMTWSRTGRFLAIYGPIDTTIVEFVDGNLNSYKKSSFRCAFRAAVFFPDEKLLVGVQKETLGTRKVVETIKAVSVVSNSHPVTTIHIPESVCLPEDTPLVACEEDAVAICGTVWRINANLGCHRSWKLGSNALYSLTGGPVQIGKQYWTLTVLEPSKSVGPYGVFDVEKTLLLAQSSDGAHCVYIPWPKDERIFGMQVSVKGKVFIQTETDEDKYGNSHSRLREYDLTSTGMTQRTSARRYRTRAVGR